MNTFNSTTPALHWIPTSGFKKWLRAWQAFLVSVAQARSMEPASSLLTDTTFSSTK